MFFDKIKKFLDEKKTICVIGGLILFGIFLYFQVRDDNMIENEPLGNKMQTKRKLILIINSIRHTVRNL